jgi:DNA-binding NtrC family response regulator/ligand-binding sensor domain-containing protein
MSFLFYKSRHTLIIFSLLLVVNAFSQSEDIRFEHLTVSDGLPHNHIKCILQDHLGFLWFTTQNGLVKYDGYNFKTYIPEPDDTNSINTRNPIWVIEDHLGDLWISSREEGLIKFDRRTETFKHYTHDDNDPNSIISNGTYHLYEDKAGTLWIGMIGEGLAKFDRETETFTNYRNDPDNINSLSSNAVNIITEDSEGNLWVGTSFGLNKYNRETGKSIRYFHEPENPNSLVHNQIHEIMEDKSGNIWIATAGGLSKYDYKKNLWKNYVNKPDNPHSLSENYIATVFEDSKGKIWVGTNIQGLNLFEPDLDGFIQYRTDANNPYSINGDWVWAINEDRTGVLWFGCWLTGLNKVDLYKKKFKHYKHIPGNRNSLSSNWVWCLYTDSDGILWIGTRGGGLNRFNPISRTFKNYPFEPGNRYGLSNNNVETIIEDPQGYLWLGTNDGLNRFDRQSETFRRYYNDDNNLASLSNNDIQILFIDSFGVLWVGTHGGGLDKLDLNKYNENSPAFTHYQNDPGNPNSLSFNIVHVIFEDSFGNMWLGTDRRGVDKFNRKTESFEHYYNSKTGLDVIFNILEDRAGRLWIGTYRGGLQLLDRKTGEREIFTEKDGLAHNSIKGMLEDDMGNLWLGTERGISRFNYENKSFRNYDVSEGLQSDLFHFRATSIGSDGVMYFGGDNGFNEFNPNKLIDNPYPPQVVIADIKLFDTSLPIGGDSPLNTNINIAKDIVLAYDQNDITLEYVALHYSRSEEITYQFQLQNYDRDWREAETRRFANYTNLPPGEYTFLVKATSSDGVVSNNPAVLNIIIVPPFWQTAWFRILVIIIILSVLFIAYKLRIKHLEKKRKLLEERVAERTEAARKLKVALDEVEILKNRLHAENVYLQSELKVEHNFENIISTSDEFNKVLQSVEQVASTDSTVLILGETGTGKELLARAIHSISKRSDRPLVKVNCATLPENLIESELFGHEKGAFTGAIARKIGRFDLANRGTIFLDEIGELPLGLQTKLLRVLQEGEFERLGDPKTIKVDVRIIAATNRNLEKEIENRNFREDLFYRLNVFPIKIPPLRDRKEDIPLLVKHFLKKYNRKAGKDVELISQDVMTKLQSYDWPGNIRELENIMERAVVTSTGKKLVLGDWLSKSELSKTRSKILPLEEMEKQHIIDVLEISKWKVSGENGAADILEINPQTLVSRMKKLGIHKP